MEPVSALKNYLKKYREQRGKLLQLIQEYVNKTNELTFVNNDMIQSSVGADVKSSRAAFRLNDRLEELSASITLTLSDIAVILQDTMTCRLKIKSSSSIDEDFVDRVLSQIQQQHLLESTIVDKIVGVDSSAIDPDSMVTMIACFEYPPYLQESDLDAVLSIT